MTQNTTNAAIIGIIILIVGVSVSALLMIFTTVLGGQTYNLVESDIDLITSYTTEDSNHTFTALNNTWSWVTIGNTSIRSGHINIYKASTMVDVTANFTINYTTGLVNLVKISGTTTDALNNSACYAIYTYDDGLIRDYVRDGIASTLKAQLQVGNYLPIIVLAIIITIIIGLIVTGLAGQFMPGNRNSGDGSVF
jgi:hypothetical protein